jgi:S-formylglutathione hydrolase FrmB
MRRRTLLVLALLLALLPLASAQAKAPMTTAAATPARQASPGAEVVAVKQVAQRDIWAAHDPYYLAQRLKSLPVYLSCGDGTAGPVDPPGKVDALEADFNRQNHALAAELQRVGAKHLTTNFYGPGTHAWAYWQRELHASLPMLLAALGVR